jgi:hypothetical protein
VLGAELILWNVLVMDSGTVGWALGLSDVREFCMRMPRHNEEPLDETVHVCQHERHANSKEEPCRRRGRGDSGRVEAVLGSHVAHEASLALKRGGAGAHTSAPSGRGRTGRARICRSPIRQGPGLYQSEEEGKR